ncbi:MAG: hypothetical protein IPP57_10625 [Candidatus Obscuribacter sp.]|nr:hypothetical protein [Candidatus Obscuribacter sp.]
MPRSSEDKHNHCIEQCFAQENQVAPGAPGPAKNRAFSYRGRRLVLEALNRDIELEAIVVVDNYLDKESELLERLDTVTAVSPALFKELVTTSSPCKVVAIGRWQLSDLNATLKDGATTVLWGENIQDPGNLGTMIRSALAFGVDALVLTSSVDPFNPKVVRSAMGGLFDLPICLCPLNRAANCSNSTSLK